MEIVILAKMVRKHFRILAPFTHVEDVKLLKDAGADELYCGYVTKKLTDRWPLSFNIPATILAIAGAAVRPGD